MVSAAAPLVPASSSSQHALHHRSWVPSVGEVLRLSRLKFLQECLRTSLAPDVSTDVIAGSRASTVRQYESVWNAFWFFLRNRPVSHLSVSILFDFL